MMAQRRTGPAPRPAIDRLTEKYVPEPNTGCWLWTARVNPGGYGAFDRSVCGSSLAHRASWTLHRGAIPAGMVIDHLCRVRCCVNPDHMRVVTRQVNTLENSESPAAAYAARTGCPKCGGEFDTCRRSKDGIEWRICRACDRAKARKYGKEKGTARARERRQARRSDVLRIVGPEGDTTQ